MLSCSEVITRHTDYIDGLMTALESECVRAHLETCRQCARYDRVIRRGVSLLKGQPALVPDADFLAELRNRIEREDARRTMPISTTAAATLSVAAVVALVAGLPFLVLAREQSAASAWPANAAVGTAATTEIAWHANAAIDAGVAHSELAAPAVTLSNSNADVSTIDPGYAPLTLESPTAPPSYVSFTKFETR